MLQDTIYEDLKKLLDVLPPKIVHNLHTEDLTDSIEFVLDLGRTPEVRFSNGSYKYIGEDLVTKDDLEYVTSRIADFTGDNRAGVPTTLHRISAIKNRKGDVVGLTCRIGRAITGTIECITDLVQTGKSILLLGKPGVGKTTKLREVARLLADKMAKRVVVVDTSNEIAGDGDIPHHAIGRARRMQVKCPTEQQHVMIEAVENHTPEAIVVDEIGTKEEANAARTIAERGVMLVATAHGNTLDNLIKNPVLSDLVGGVTSVTLGDDEAKRRATQKTVLEREKEPTFDMVIEIRDRNTLAIYPNTAEAVDSILKGWMIYPEIRRTDVSSDKVKVLNVGYEPVKLSKTPVETSVKPIIPPEYQAQEDSQMQRVYIYALSRSIVDKVIERMALPIEVTRTIEDADIVLSLKSYAKSGSKITQVAKNYNLPIHFVKANTLPQIQHTILQALNIDYRETDKLDKEYFDETEAALEETRQAIYSVMQKEKPVSLSPRKTQIRKLQHELIEKYNLYSISVGEGADRYIKVLPKSEDYQDVG